MEYVQRLVALGLKRATAERLESLVNLWTQSSGPEWTVSRLKQIKLAILNHRAGRPLDLKWVKVDNLGIPTGPLGELFRLAVTSDKGLFIAVNSTMIYSSFVNDSITEKQRQKFFGSMESEDRTGLSSLSTGNFKLSDTKIRMKQGQPWTNSLLSEKVFQPGRDGKSYPETDTVVSFEFAACSVVISDLMTKYHKLFKEVVPLRLITETRNHYATRYARGYEKPNDDVLRSVGKISYIQEPGLKLRAVANPNRVIQAVLEPLKRALGEVLRSLPNDSTFDQESGVQWVQDELKSGKTIHSIDLSDATNLFPLSYTQDVLSRRLGVHENSQERYNYACRIFVEVARSPWFSKENGEVKLHSFTRGQPLGLGPSFFAFALSHHCLIQDLCKDLGLTSPYPYRILGDDICISDDILARSYSDKVRSIGCMISIEKSMTSDRIAEFGGKIITSNSKISQFKWRELNDLNFLDFCRNIGPKSLALLSSKQKSVINTLYHVPDWIGGMGWNPEGLPLDIRLALPFSQFMFAKGDPEVFLPHVRVDRPIRQFMVDYQTVREKQALDLRRGIVPVVRPEPLLLMMAPDRDPAIMDWGNLPFWKRFQKADASKQPQGVHFSVRDRLDFPRFLSRELFQPVYRLDGPFDKVVANPWFDIVLHFSRTNRQIDQSH